CARGDGGFAFW
nr:immunoglobulin heavy chain junction region [Mus musculus]